MPGPWEHFSHQEYVSSNRHQNSTFFPRFSKLLQFNLPELHSIRSSLNHLLKKEITRNWSPECKAAFAKIKASLSSDLTHFNPSLDIVLVSDASDYGVGAMISHIFPGGSQKTIAHASRSLTSAEMDYGQIEKEALTIIYTIKKFHKMVYGRHFTLVTDHKPLVSIFLIQERYSREHHQSITMMGYHYTGLWLLDKESFNQFDWTCRCLIETLIHTRNNQKLCCCNILGPRNIFNAHR